MNEEFEKSLAKLKARMAERVAVGGELVAADVSAPCVIWLIEQLELAWQASRKQALEDAAVKAEFTICECCWREEAKEAAEEIAFQIRAMVGNKVSIPSLLEKQTTVPATVPVPRADVDQLVAPAAVRTEEIDTEVVNARLDGIQSNFGAATDADPHDRLLSEGADLHDRQTGQSVQAARAANTAIISADSAVNSSEADHG
ncbi:MAG: hypothetical protein INH06_16110 [Cupriavidus sp.]|nr:hypothetical protein [Cupriavidus sp.]